MVNSMYTQQEIEDILKYVDSSANPTNYFTVSGTRDSVFNFTCKINGIQFTFDLDFEGYFYFNSSFKKPEKIQFINSPLITSIYFNNVDSLKDCSELFVNCPDINNIFFPTSNAWWKPEKFDNMFKNYHGKIICNMIQQHFFLDNAEIIGLSQEHIDYKDVTNDENPYWSVTTAI